MIPDRIKTRLVKDRPMTSITLLPVPVPTFSAVVGLPSAR